MKAFSYEYIFNNVDSGIIALDTDMIITNINENASTILARTSKDMVGQSCCNIIKTPYCINNCPAMKTFETGKPQEYTQMFMKNSQGRTIPVRLSTFPIKDAEKKVTGVIFIFNDQRKLYQTNFGRFQQLGIVGISPKMKEVFHLIETVADTDSNVLIIGNTGTGKELVADAIHKISARGDKPFIKVNCAALADSILESELFGHEKGAFTGALNKRIGRFEAANTGTIFLDEISEISPGFQAKLLRVIQERELERVGSSNSIKVNIRIIAATNKDLTELVKNNLFREDLYYRINIFPIYLPPLCERKDDIVPLVEYFINEFNTKFTSRQKSQLSEEALNILRDYNYPGNIRELRNIIEHAFIKSQDVIINREALPDYMRHNSSNTVKNTMQQYEQEYIMTVINECKGNKALAARKLGISRKTIYNKLK